MKVFIRAVLPSDEIRKRWRIESGRAVIWDSNNKRMKPVLCHVGQKFKHGGSEFQIVDDERFPSVIQESVRLAQKGYPLELGLHLCKV